MKSLPVKETQKETQAKIQMMEMPEAMMEGRTKMKQADRSSIYGKRVGKGNESDRISGEACREAV
jgi:hypothetical protein